MNYDKNRAKIKKQLQALRAELEALRHAASIDQKPVSLDQQSVGRLSRMDSMQVQAMAQAGDARRVQETRRVDAALQRLEEDEYGACMRCGEDIAPERLTKDPATPFCVSCAG